MVKGGGGRVHWEVSESVDVLQRWALCSVHATVSLYLYIILPPPPPPKTRSSNSVQSILLNDTLCMQRSINRCSFVSNSNCFKTVVFRKHLRHRTISMKFHRATKTLRLITHSSYNGGNCRAFE
jgi:hypothetical protein